MIIVERDFKCSASRVSLRTNDFISVYPSHMRKHEHATVLSMNIYTQTIAVT